ncbi:MULTISPECIES: hypothetical protein [unclassified Streptomyces]|uniref:hypothetical protein n=1 Tax=unclassified Streptomyces TaxID=2593676 RepID=UPI002E347A4F|nr:MULTISPECIES: hypothetical protein [unclassified Streptomyces]WUC68214.1 hypothetical protein OG861_30425 [Streptomyces sp. NBC_00539]
MVHSPFDVSSTHGQRMHWKLGGFGSATWSWSVDAAEQTVRASYVGPEVLACFMNAVRDLLLECSATFVTFFNEPSGTRVFFNRAEKEVFVQIVEFADLNEPSSWWSDARLVWAGRVPAEAFVGAFMAMIEQLLSEHGTDGYRRRWGHEFPAPEWAALQAVHRSR